MLLFIIHLLLKKANEVEDVSAQSSPRPHAFKFRSFNWYGAWLGFPDELNHCDEDQKGVCVWEREGEKGEMVQIGHIV